MQTGHKKIDNQNVQNILSLTPMQEGMLFHYLHDIENYYFEQLCLKIRGKIKMEVMRKAWNYVIEANEMLRTIFRWEKLQKPVQIILKTYEVPLRIHDLSNLTDSEKEQKIYEIQEQDQHNQIDISKEPFRVTLVKLSSNENMMIISNHHILYDGWSNGIILKELFQTYAALYKGQHPINSQKNRFNEFIKWLQLQNKDHQKKYWVNYLEDFDTKTELPVLLENKDSREIQKNTQTTKSYVHTFDEDATKCINMFVTEHRITFASLIYSVWGILLQRYNNTDDVLFGTTVSGRNAKIAGLEKMVGLFINTIPLRVRVKANSEESILTFLKNIENSLKERMEYENVPLVDIRSYSGLDNKESLFDSIIVIENYPLDKQINENNNILTVESYSMLESTNFDLTLAVEMNNQITMNFAYNSLKLEERLIKRMSEHFSNIINYILKKTDGKLPQIDILSNEERNQLLYAFNNT
ncbi:MAG: hypothetical protein KAX49_08285, partial [Halanaerobiales bacterium]|nr:hypothetical protein [Halanaerobiales bacterium]